MIIEGPNKKAVNLGLTVVEYLVGPRKKNIMKHVVKF